MPLYIKTEKITQDTLNMFHKDRSKYIIKHKQWVESLVKNGRNIFSGYLTTQEGNPGEGGILLIEANNFEEAKFLIMQDPMIKNNLVTWKLNQWIPVSGEFSHKLILDIVP